VGQSGKRFGWFPAVVNSAVANERIKKACQSLVRAERTLSIVTRRDKSRRGVGAAKPCGKRHRPFRLANQAVERRRGERCRRSALAGNCDLWPAGGFDHEGS